MEVLLLRVPEAARSLGLSRAKVYELIKAGTLASVRVDGSRRIPACDLRAYVDALRQEAA